MGKIFLSFIFNIHSFDYSWYKAALYKNKEEKNELIYVISRIVSAIVPLTQHFSGALIPVI